MYDSAVPANKLISSKPAFFFVSQNKSTDLDSKYLQKENLRYNPLKSKFRHLYFVCPPL